MTDTLQDAAKKFVKAVALDRHDVEDWPEASREAFDTLEKIVNQQETEETIVAIPSVELRCK